MLLHHLLFFSTLFFHFHLHKHLHTVCTHFYLKNLLIYLGNHPHVSSQRSFSLFLNSIAVLHVWVDHSGLQQVPIYLLHIGFFQYFAIINNAIMKNFVNRYFFHILLEVYL